MVINSHLIIAQSISACNISYATSENGKIYRWGYNVMGYGSEFPVDISNMGALAGHNIAAVSVGREWVLALTDKGKVIYWKNPDYEMESDEITESDPAFIDGLSDVIEVESGGDFGSYVLKADGSVYKVLPILQKVEGLENIINISANTLDDLIAVKADGSVYTKDGQITGLAGIIAVSAGWGHFLALKKDGTVWAWGSNDAGQLGQGNFDYAENPVQVNGLTGVIAIEAASGTSYALKANGTVYAWGNGSSGQLGDGINYDKNGYEFYYRPMPAKIDGLNNIKLISSKSDFAFAMDTVGKVYGWGFDYFNSTGTEEGALDWDYMVTRPALVKDLRLMEKYNTKDGVINWQQWTNLPTGNLSTVPVNNKPDKEALLTSFEAGSNIGSNYGSRVQGYVKPPQTGKYTFYISSDDHSELWLSTSTNPAAKTKIASISGYTKIREWFKLASQKSVEINLVAGEMYYIEALHKENSGVDHLAVAWRLPDGTLEGPIPAARLASYITAPNISPSLTCSLADKISLPEGTPVQIDITATDPDGSIVKVEYYLQDTKVGEATASPYTLTLTDLPAGNYMFYAKATDDKGGIGAHRSFFDVHTVTAQCNATGYVEREKWNNLPAGNLSTIPFGTTANSKQVIYDLEAPSNDGNSYGSRIRGYICAPITGYYTFHIASDDHSELWFSTYGTPNGIAKIASVNGYTGIRQWNKYQSQKSPLIHLKAGQKYYFEVRHKENGGLDHLSVAWTMADGTFEAPIKGIRLSPFEDNTSSITTARVAQTDETPLDVANKLELKAYPNPFSGDATIQLTGLKAGPAMLKVYDLQGNLVQKLFDGQAEAGANYEFNLNASRILPGLYICRFEQGGKAINLKIVKL